MATDTAKILVNLASVYDFGGKSVVHVGAGGGQLVAWAAVARHVIAVDPDEEAVGRLRAAIEAHGLQERFTVRQAEFEAVTDRADVVFFEFCLHEMADPAAALRHARRLAPEAVVIDHSPDSPWAWHTAETDKAARSWEAVEGAGIRIERRFAGRQLFPDVEALVSRLASLGEPAVARARALGDVKGIDIEMLYRVAVV